MSETSDVPGDATGQALKGEVVESGETHVTPEVIEQPQPDVSDPAKLIRLGTMLQTMLVELKGTETDAAGLHRLAQIHNETIEELEGILSDDLHQELLEFNACCGNNDTPTEGEMRVAHAQLVGWIQGLFRGMQATATAQAAMAQQQMMMMQAQAQQRALAGAGGRPGAPQDTGPSDSGYL